MRNVTLETTLYRRHSRTRQALSTEGARLSGGRYNHPGTPVLYLASSRELAVREFEKHRDVVGLNVSKPGLCSSIHVRLVKVLDLTNEKVRSELGVTIEQLCAEDPELTRKLGDAARLAGYDAVRYPAAVDPSQWNVAVFEENMRPDAVEDVSRDDHWPEQR